MSRRFAFRCQIPSVVPFRPTVFNTPKPGDDPKIEPLNFLLAVMRSGDQPTDRRLEAAKAALRIVTKYAESYGQRPISLTFKQIRSHPSDSMRRSSRVQQALSIGLE
jgi:hypothetical protein